MKHFTRGLCLFLAAASLLLLGGCSGGFGSLLGAGAISKAYAGQSSVLCTLEYHVAVNADIGGLTLEGMEQSFSGDAQVDIANNNCYMTGELITYLDGIEAGVTEMEYYGVSGDEDGAAYYRYDGSYYADTAASFLDVMNAPVTLDMSGFEKQDSPEIINGVSYDVYICSEPAGEGEQTIASSLVDGSFSLEGCTVEAELRAYQDTSLPASLEIRYLGLEDCGVSFTAEDGNGYTITDISMTVTYNNYGRAVSVEVPQEFKGYALSGYSEPVEEDDYDYDYESQSYYIYDDDYTYCYEIAAPEYMELDSLSTNAVGFYYYFSENDYEIIDFTVYTDFTGEDEAAYARSLADYLTEDEGFSGVSASEVQSMTVGDYDVSYVTVYATLTDEDGTYDVMYVYSWTEAPNGQDCLEITVSEYNGEGDGLFVDAESELEYAYEAILEYSED